MCSVGFASATWPSLGVDTAFPYGGETDRLPLITTLSLPRVARAFFPRSARRSRGTATMNQSNATSRSLARSLVRSFPLVARCLAICSLSETPRSHVSESRLPDLFCLSELFLFLCACVRPTKQENTNRKSYSAKDEAWKVGKLRGRAAGKARQSKQASPEGAGHARGPGRGNLVADVWRVRRVRPAAATGSRSGRVIGATAGERGSRSSS